MFTKRKTKKFYISYYFISFADFIEQLRINAIVWFEKRYWIDKSIVIRWWYSNKLKQ